MNINIVNARAVYPQLTNEDWENLGYNDNSQPRQSNLDNHNLLDMFSFFDANNGPALDFPQNEYTFNQLSNLLRAGFLLASAFLQSPAAIRFLYAVLHGNYQDIPNLTQDFGTPVRQLDLPDLPSKDVSYKAMQDEVNKVLNRLASCTKLALAKESELPQIRRLRALTRPAWDEGTPTAADVLDNSNRRGVASSVRINEKYVTVLRDLHRNTNANAFAILTANFMFGKTLFHEMIHVLYNAISPESREYMLWRKELNENPSTTQKPIPEPIEPLFQEQQVSELGRAGDAYVFGGSFEWDWNIPGHNIPAFYPRICDWPSFQSRDREYLREPEPPQYTKQFIVPGWYIKRIQQKSFWATVRETQITALRVAQMYGVQYQRDPNFNHTPLGVQRQHLEDPDPSSARINEPYQPGAKIRYTNRNNPLKWANAPKASSASSA